jgi:hypothetical protein
MTNKIYISMKVIRKEDAYSMTIVDVFLAAGKWLLAFGSLYF